jgi:hypothetical protein
MSDKTMLAINPADGEGHVECWVSEEPEVAPAPSPSVQEEVPVEHSVVSEVDEKAPSPAPTLPGKKATSVLPSPSQEPSSSVVVPTTTIGVCFLFDFWETKKRKMTFEL